jgi:hypothetical protein
LRNNQSNAANEDMTGYVHIINPSASAFCSVVWSFEAYGTGSDTGVTIGGGRRGSAADVDAIQFLMSSGNLTSGTFKLYGIPAA